MQDPFEDQRDTGGGMSCQAFLFLVVLVIAGMLILANTDFELGPQPSPTAPVPSPSVSR